MKLIIFSAVFFICAEFSAASTELKIEKPFVAPGALTVNTETEVQINFRFSPADYAGGLTVVEVSRKGKRLKTLAQISGSSSTEQVLGTKRPTSN